jgi:hypothetical protein
MEDLVFFADEQGAPTTAATGVPDPAWLEKLVAEGERQEGRLWEVVKSLTERQLRLAQVWLAGAALFAWPKLSGSGTNLDLWLAGGFGLGFLGTLLGLRFRLLGPIGPGLSDFNGWDELRRPQSENLQVLLSTWQVIIARRVEDLSRRGQHFNWGLWAFGAYLVAALIIQSLR